MRDRAEDYLRFANDLRVPFDNDLASRDCNFNGVSSETGGDTR